jgi:hypothetical protein
MIQESKAKEGRRRRRRRRRAKGSQIKGAPS